MSTLPNPYSQKVPDFNVPKVTNEGYSHDQPNNAARVERLGVGLTISRGEYNAANVVAKLHQLLNEPSFARQSAEVGRQIQLENGVRVACDAIEAQLSYS